MGSKLIRAGGSSESEAGESGDCPIRGRGITPSTRQHRLEEVLMAGHVAVAETEVNAKPDEVCSALTDPMQSSSTCSALGSRQTGKRAARSCGRASTKESHTRIEGDDNRPENYHTVLYELENDGEMTRVRLTQDNNKTAEAADHSQTNWEKMLTGLKEVVERD
jgi:hypothetical protein